MREAATATRLGSLGGARAARAGESNNDTKQTAAHLVERLEHEARELRGLLLGGARREGRAGGDEEAVVVFCVSGEKEGGMRRG